MTLHLEPMEKSDENFEFALAMKKEALGPYIIPRWGWDEERQRKMHAERWATRPFWTIVLDGERIGTVSIDDMGDHLVLAEFYIRPAFHRQGIGTRILGSVLADAERNGLTVRLQCLKWNPARSLYERHGFTTIGETETHLLMERPVDRIPKYAALEIERRWLVDIAAVGDLAAVPFRRIEDLYIESGRLRLRKVIEPDGRCLYKLGKKYGKNPAGAEPVANLYLTEAEHAALSRLPGSTTSKRRYSIAGGGLDVYEHPHAGLAIFEVEFADESAARTYSPPGFVTREITGDPPFSGAALAGANARTLGA